MPQRDKPPFRADQVGSLLRSAKLKTAREAKARNEIDAAALRRIEDEEIRAVVRLQEEIGLRAVTDGEYRRGSWQRDFLMSFANVAVTTAKFKARFRSSAGETERDLSAFAVTGKFSRPRGIFVEDFKFLKSVAHALPKQTIPSPTLLHFRGGRALVDTTAYPEMAQFFADVAKAYGEEIADLAAAGCRYLQLDDTNFAYLCDPALREQVRGIGEDPETLPRTYVGLINDAIAARPRDMSVCIHICRGNFRSSWMAEGGYDPIAEVLFNEAKVDGFFLEYDSARAGGFEPLRFLPKGKIAVLGLVTTKTGTLESKDALKRRIDEAQRYAPLEQLALSPQCGFASAAEGNDLALEDEIAKLRLVVEVAREVWGG